MSLATSVDQTRSSVAELAQREADFRHNFDAALLGMLMLEFDPATGVSRIARANSSARRLLELDGSEAEISWRALLADPTRHEVGALLQRMARGEVATWTGELEHVVGSKRRWMDASIAVLSDRAADGSVRLTLQLVDVTARRHAEDRLTEMALYDNLTALPNRALLIDRLELALASCRRTRTLVGTLFIDVDEFKTINDADGHDIGDEVLKEVGRRIQGAVRPGDTVGRLGGDEFVVVCPDVDDVADVKAVADRLMAAIHEPLTVAGRTYDIDVSVGVSVAGDGIDAMALLRQADTAMYAAKGRGKGRTEMFREEMHVRAARQADLAPRLRQALSLGEFRLHFQPIVDLGSNRPIAVEALIRWQHPQRGLLPPAEWLDVVERSDLVVAMGRWVLQEACRWAATWKESLGPLAPLVHVNVSARHLSDSSFMADVHNALRDSGCAAQWLVLEVTETHLLTVTGSLHRDLGRLRQMGIRLSADDYGTGFSSLSQVIELEVDSLKIDKSFVMAMDESARALAVVQAVIGLGNALGLEVVAEGIERPEHAEALLRMGCLSGQGYLWSPARSPEELEALLRGWSGSLVRTSSSPASAMFLSLYTASRLRPSAAP